MKNNCPYSTGPSYSSGFTKYNTKSDYGTVDNKTTLEASDDAATVHLGGKWRMPTDAEWRELIDNCTWTRTTLNGIEGYMVTSKKNGNSIFLPASGCRGDNRLHNDGTYCHYWSSSLFFFPYEALSLMFNPGNGGVSTYSRFYGCSVRPVSE